MKIRELHAWNVGIQEAKEWQIQLRERLILRRAIEIPEIKTVAAADISFNRFGKILYGAVVILSFPALELLEVHLRRAEALFPYVPGYLSFREAPVILDIFKEITRPPDVLLCDGQGIAHPRGLGLASHLGLFLDLPTIGCAKSVLVGKYEEPAGEKGSRSPLIYQGVPVGTVLRTRANVKPVFVSVGHKTDLEQAARIVLRCAPRYRIPEPIRRAHQAVNDLRRKEKQGL